MEGGLVSHQEWTGGTERKALEGVATIFVSGMCSIKGSYNGVYVPVAYTASGRPWYRNENGMSLYWDPDCNGGDGENRRWIFDNQEPSITAEEDLDGEWRRRGGGKKGGWC